MKLNLPVICIGLFLAHFGLSSGSLAQTPTSDPAKSTGRMTLEGIKFVGPFGAEDETNPKQDTFTFKDGKFATGSCLEWGFTPAPYWVRRDDKGRPPRRLLRLRARSGTGGPHR